jgi:hypothetical protein
MDMAPCSQPKVAFCSERHGLGAHEEHLGGIRRKQYTRVARVPSKHQDGFMVCPPRIVTQTNELAREKKLRVLALNCCWLIHEDGIKVGMLAHEALLSTAVVVRVSQSADPAV